MSIHLCQGYGGQSRVSGYPACSVCSNAWARSARAEVTTFSFITAALTLFSGERVLSRMIGNNS